METEINCIFSYNLILFSKDMYQTKETGVFVSFKQVNNGEKTNISLTLGKLSDSRK